MSLKRRTDNASWIKRKPQFASPASKIRFDDRTPAVATIIGLQLIFLATFSNGSIPNLNYHEPGKIGRSLGSTATLSSSPASANCTEFYTTKSGETCSSLRVSQNLTQAQIRELNPELNCNKLQEGQSVCVQGIPANCKRTLLVEQGSASNSSWPTCKSIADAAGLSMRGLFVLNPRLSCPEAEGNNNSWPSSRLICVAPGLGKTFVEYMGSSGTPIDFGDVETLVQSFDVIYHVVLAFVGDADGAIRNGKFTPYWGPSVTPEAARAFKNSNLRARLLMSIGGDDLHLNLNHSDPVIWEDPANVEDWINNAQYSLTSIVESYSIDGIDINYQNFPTTNSTFAYCIGTLIERLKGNNTIGIATIAPSRHVIPEYTDLMNGYGDLVDFVNFQFYLDYDLPTVDAYMEQFQSIAEIFDPWKLLASTEVAGKHCITGEMFQEAVVKLYRHNGLIGIMLWDADTSRSYNFTEEKGLLTILSGSQNDPFTPGPALAPSTNPLRPSSAPSPGPNSAAPSNNPVIPSLGPPQGTPPTTPSPPRAPNLGPPPGRNSAAGLRHSSLWRSLVGFITTLVVLFAPFA